MTVMTISGRHQAQLPSQTTASSTQRFLLLRSAGTRERTNRRNLCCMVRRFANLAQRHRNEHASLTALDEATRPACCAPAPSFCNWATLSTGVPSTESTTSPCWIPASAARPSASSTMSPPATPACRRSSGFNGRKAKPNRAGADSAEESSAVNCLPALPMVAVNDRTFPSRHISSGTLSPGAAAPTRCDNWPASTIEAPLNLRITSPTLMPACAAALSEYDRLAAPARRRGSSI